VDPVLKSLLLFIIIIIINIIIIIIIIIITIIIIIIKRVDIVAVVRLLGIETIYRYLPSVTGLAIDWLGDNLYWMDGSNIFVSRTDGRFLKTLLGRSEVNTDIALDPERG